MSKKLVAARNNVSEIPWTTEMLDRFMIAEVCVDELMQIGDEFPGVFPPDVQRALNMLKCGPWRGFVEEPLESRAPRMRAIRGRLDAAFPCNYRTTLEALGD